MKSARKKWSRSLLDSMPVTPRRAAKELGCSVARIYQLTKGPELWATQYPNGRIAIERRELERFKAVYS